ncbi:dihydrofolate reductase family protein [Phocaeicola barnesiae]|uniref:dihydrofolate reductase family protein n=1 Tax=Phocaeicola barnesiae TaxID=376804 RepID=UPI0003AB2C46|nr:dihydrofolate reductase family protein [Phocaeicola barnesiae]
MKPYVICHMVASIDGRIDCSMVDKISGEEYYTALEQLDCPSLLEGRVTMEHYNAAKEPFVPTEYEPVGQPSVYIAEESDAYMVSVDTLGHLRWNSNRIDDVPLVCIVSERVSKEYLEMLRKQGISWIAVGNENIDLDTAMNILYEQFHVKRLALLGGGHINGGFLQAGLIDEVSLLVAPGIDGRKNGTAVFDGIGGDDRLPVHLHLTSVERLENDVIWLRYRL